jgi:hypothetical protein
MTLLVQSRRDADAKLHLFQRLLVSQNDTKRFWSDELPFAIGFMCSKWP